MWSFLKQYQEAALLFLRAALGGVFIYAHGWPKLAGGLKRWKEVGMAMKHIGISFAPGFWGFMASFSESIGCVFLILGLFFRPAAILLFITMTVASITMWLSGGISKAAHPIEMAIIFFALIFIGPGKYSIDKG